MAEAKTGDLIRAHYTIKLEDGTVFDSSLEREPLLFSIGKGDVIPGFENTVTGMKEGETKTVSIPPKDAYGNYVDNLVFVLKRSDLPPDIEPKLGVMLHGQSESGESISGTIKEIKEKTITLDVNHPLAGKTLIFEIKLLEIISPS
jgi:FKBP-type peptidyl-prolyl cis-trans isomerase 2